MKLRVYYLVSGFLVAILIIQIVVAGGSVANYTVNPRIGQCYMLTSSEIDLSYAIRNPVPCSKLHNAEVFLVARWPLSINPADMDHDEAWQIAHDTCDPDAAFDEFEFFNYWAWYTPDRSAWKKGQRWIRCDAMKLKNFKKPYIYLAWRGSKL